MKLEGVMAPTEVVLRVIADLVAGRWEASEAQNVRVRKSGSAYARLESLDYQIEVETLGFELYRKCVSLDLRVRVSDE